MSSVGAERDTSDLALNALRDFIRSGAVGPTDARLPGERDLARALQFGRRSVRRALDVLETEGLVRRRPGHGFFLALEPPRPVPTPEVVEVIEARARLEPVLAALAAARARPPDIRRLRLLDSRFLSAGDADAAELWGGALHRCIAEIAGNRHLLEAHRQLERARLAGDWRRLIERRGAAPRDSSARSNAEHAAIIAAIAAGDPSAAEAAMRAHLGSIAASVERLLGVAAPEARAEAVA